MCQYIIMPFSSNFYLFVFGNVIENRMTNALNPPCEGGKGDVPLAMASADVQC